MASPTVAVTLDRLDLEELTRAVARSDTGADGAIASFVGIVRGENRGRRVLYLEYEAYEPLAVRVLEQIRDEAAGRWGAARIAIHHRVGRLEIGDASIMIASASPHRADAFAACRYAIERVKQIAPIWKHEFFEDGDEWIEGAAVHPEDEAAREDALRKACA